MAPDTNPEEAAGPALDWPESGRLCPSTERSYNGLVRKYLLEYAASTYPEADNPMDALTDRDLEGFCRWLVQTYRNATHLGCKHRRNIATAIRNRLGSLLSGANLEELSLLHRNTGDCPALPAATSSRIKLHVRRITVHRLKTPDDEQVDRLFKALGQKNSDTARLTLQWLEATLACGARPREWFDARWEDVPDGGLLCLKNSKFNPQWGRGNGLYRHLFFLGPEQEQNITRIKTFLQNLHSTCTREGSGRLDLEVFQRVQKRCTTCLSRLQCRDKSALGPDPRVITFYTMRHLFAARIKEEVKRTGCDKSLASALLGHSVMENVWRYYADRPLASRGRNTPLPFTREQATVRAKSHANRTPVPDNRQHSNRQHCKGQISGQDR